MHGDQFDVVVRHARWLAFLGDWAYDFAMFINTLVQRGAPTDWRPYWSFQHGRSSR